VQNEFNFLRVVERVIIVVVTVVMSAYNNYSSIGGGRTERGPDFVPVVVHVSHHFLLDATRRRHDTTVWVGKERRRTLGKGLGFFNTLNKKRETQKSGLRIIAILYTRARCTRINRKKKERERERDLFLAPTKKKLLKERREFNFKRARIKLY